MDSPQPSARTAQLLRAGLTPADIQRHLDDNRLTRVSWGVYARPAAETVLDGPEKHRQDHAALAHHLLPLFPGAYVVGPSACLVHGLPLHATPQRLHVAREPRVRSRRPEIMTHRAWSHRVETVDGPRVQSVTAALIETAAAMGLLHGLVSGDAAAHRGMALDDAEATLNSFGSKRGATSARLCMELLDGRRESPLETWAAYEAHVAGFRLTPQVGAWVRGHSSQKTSMGNVWWIWDRISDPKLTKRCPSSVSTSKTVT